MHINIAMIKEYLENFTRGKVQKVLVTPLNWGLGHATRCIPIIRNLLTLGHEVHIGSDGLALSLLQNEFPDLHFIELPGYNIQYYGRNLTTSLLLQSPKMLIAILKENKVVRSYCKKHGINTVISDNRFGCRSSRSHNIIISHQLRILLPAKISANLATQINHYWLKQVQEIWVPDYVPPNNLTGAMTDKGKLAHVKYIGPLSRFERLDLAIQYDIIVILSGPEPLRAQLEQILLNQLIVLDKKVLLVRGLPGMNVPIMELPTRIEVKTFLPATALNVAICSAQLVICRTGYTSVMDLVYLEKEALLIPTPGQPEQEYLAKQLIKNPLFIVCNQDQLDLSLQLKLLVEKSQKKGNLSG